MTEIDAVYRINLEMQTFVSFFDRIEKYQRIKW